VIAEGVETEEQLAFLREQECDEMQGFVFSQPLSAARLTRILRPQPAGRGQADPRVLAFPLPALRELAL
ncbi:MAG: EAL domain-containing protein, partial [Terriglobia bacterium]